MDNILLLFGEWGIVLMKQNNTKHHSVRTKVFAYMALFVVILVTLLWLFQIVFLDNFYRMIKTNQIHATVEQIQKDWQKNGTIALDNFSQNNEMHLRLINQQGDIIQESQSFRSPNFRPINPEQMQKIFSEATTDGVLLTFDGKKIGPNPNSMDYAVRLDNNTVLLVQANLVPVHATVETLQIQLFIITAILLTCAFILSFLISKKVSDPIQQLNADAKVLGSGNFNITFTETGYQEVTELAATLNQMKIDLSEIDKLRQELLANVGHDLQTPLTMIIGYAEMMQDLPDELTPENAEVIRQEAQYLSNLVKDMLDLSKISAHGEGDANANADTNNLEDVLITALTQQVITRFTAQGHQNILFTPQADYRVQCQPLQITQVLYNLLNNAINHTAANKPITIEFAPQLNEHTLTIYIKDTGEGIDAASLPHIFDRYYRTSNSHQRLKHGSGLGLSIVRKTFDNYQIPYGVNSTLGQGTTFWFTLPLVEE